MYRIIKIGMDVHSKNFALTILEPVLGEKEKILFQTSVAADYHLVLDVIEQLKKKLGKDNELDIECGYEAGCLGYSLYHQLTSAGVKCTILAPTTMLSEKGKRIKTDARDSLLIAKCLAYDGYKSVHVPTVEDDAVKEYIRMRNAQKRELKRLKQQINSLCIRHGYLYPGVKWTLKHLQWLRSIVFALIPLQEALEEYLTAYEEKVAKIERYDKRIEELAATPEYAEDVKHLTCFKGIKTHTALSTIVEIGDFNRFPKASAFAAYLGLTPGEQSSGEHIHRTGISKAGNSNLRGSFVEAASALCLGKPGYKSKALKARQAGSTSEIIAYADKASIRLQRKYQKLIRRGKNRNTAVIAVARELACFVWGMMTGHIGLSEKELASA